MSGDHEIEKLQKEVQRVRWESRAMLIALLAVLVFTGAKQQVTEFDSITARNIIVMDETGTGVTGITPGVVSVSNGGKPPVAYLKAFGETAEIAIKGPNGAAYLGLHKEGAEIGVSSKRDSASAGLSATSEFAGLNMSNGGGASGLFGVKMSDGMFSLKGNSVTGSLNASQVSKLVANDSFGMRVYGSRVDAREERPEGSELSK